MSDMTDYLTQCPVILLFLLQLPSFQGRVVPSNKIDKLITWNLGSNKWEL